MAVQDYYAKVIRLPILPGSKKYPTEGWFGPHNGGQKYFERHIDPLVKTLTSRQIYVIIDLHYISDYDGLADKVAQFWRFMAPKYKDNPYVIYEIFNEPIYPDNWDRFKEEIAAPTVKIIRKAAPENLIIVGSPYWSSHLKGIVENPIKSTNIIYTAHIYSNQPERIWDKNYGDVINKYPVFVTEWGFEEGGTEGGTKDFGERFEKWMNQNKLSWTAWCFDNRWGPRMFDDEWNLLGGYGGMGEFVRGLLYENH
jgi:endoglucanase